MAENKKKIDLDFLKEENRHYEKVATIESSGQIIRTIIKYIGWVICFGLVAYSINSIGYHFSGKESSFKFLLTLFGNIPINVTISWSCTFFSIIWALNERRLRKEKTEYLQNRIKKFEERIDPNRSSSGLTSKGDTNPEDK